MGNWGCFPFGQRNSVRPARTADRPDAVVVGVYPSAWHVGWRAPQESATKDEPSLRLAQTPAGNVITGGVAALAVDVEPTVFWDGHADDFKERLAHWKRLVGFVDGRHGTISSVSSRANGSSGEKVVRHYLAPLGIAAGRATFTDVYPVFLVKTSNSRRREQGDAIRDEYDRIAPGMAMPASSLPARIPAAKLPGIAASTFGERLVADLSAAAAPLIVTLGREVWETLLAIPSLRARPPRERFTDLYGEAYGAVGSITVNGRETTWLPLVHPGLLKGKADPAGEVPPTDRTVKGWAILHARWAAAVAKRPLAAGAEE